MLQVVGLIPAAGQAKRLGSLPGSKELFPVGFHTVVVKGRSQLRPKVVSHYLLEAMARGGAAHVYIILSKEKIDILRYYGDGSEFGVSIAYLVIDHLGGMPYTLNQARPWLDGETVLFGMPDTVFSPPDVFVRLLKSHASAQNDLTIGLFPTDKPHRFGMVEVGSDNRVLHVIDKPAQTDLKFMWGIACWSPRFTSFMDEYLRQTPPRADREVVLGDVFQAAVNAGLAVRAHRFEDGEYIDIGTPEDLQTAVRRFRGGADSRE